MNAVTERPQTRGQSRAVTAKLTFMVPTGQRPYVDTEALTGEIYRLAFNPGQRWLHFPAMETDEALVIKGYDSRVDGRARFTPHTAFDHPDTRPDDPPRESIEVRTLAFYE